MAMFLSRIKKALNLGTKSITQNGTYNASSDGYDGYSSVEVNVAGVTPTPVTPSNASPAALTSGTAVSPTANGYAIASYSNISPNEGGAITSGGIYKATTSGYAIGEEPETLAAGSGTDDTIEDGKNYHAVGSGIAIQGFTSITPSNSSPVSLSSGEYYKPTTGGKAISSLSEVAPSNANPPDMYNGSIYKIKTRNGLLISTASLVSPSDTNPPQLLVNDTYYRINGASGYLYSNVQPKVKMGTISAPTSGTTYTVNCGFQPKKIFVYTYESSTKYMSNTYDVDVDSTYQFMGFKISSSSEGVKKYALTATNNGIISGITSTGFTWRGWSNLPSLYYVAIG